MLEFEQKKFLGRAFKYELFVSRAEHCRKKRLFCEQKIPFVEKLQDKKLAGLWELHSTCPEERLDGKKIVKSKIFFQFFETLGGMFLRGCEICRICVQKELCRKKVFFCEQAEFFVYNFWNLIVAGLSELHSTCPEEHSDDENLLKVISFFIFSIFYGKIFPRGCQMFCICVQKKLCREKINFGEQKIFSFTIFQGKL